jgi:hypothetical protein
LGRLLSGEPANRLALSHTVWSAPLSVDSVMLRF